MFIMLLNDLYRTMCLQEKPWRKPGADITDYFNYGFSEVTWNMYCERQRKLRTEFGGDQAKVNQKLFGDMKLGAQPTQHMQSNVGIKNVPTGVVKVTRIGVSECF
jgi:pre-mRNA 3'-end-processing factor FIP1